MLFIHYLNNFRVPTVLVFCAVIFSLEAAHPSLSVSQRWLNVSERGALDKASHIDSKLKGVDRGFVTQNVSTSAIPDATVSLGSKPSRRGSAKTYTKRKLSRFIEVDGVPIYSQNRQDPFDRDGYRGRFPRGYCGPTVMQMLLDYYGLQKSRDYLALTDLGTGPMYRRGQGSRYAPMVKMARHLGFEETEIVFTNNLKQLENRLRERRPQIVSLKGHLKYAKGAASRVTQGHIVLVTGIDELNRLIIHDPAGRGSRALMHAKDFRRVWRGFLVDIKGHGDSFKANHEQLMMSDGSSVKKGMVKQQSL